MDTCISYTDRNAAYFSSDEKKWIKHIKQLHEKYPDEIEILAYPEDNHGMLYAQIPVYMIRITPKRHPAFTEEQRKAASRRMIELTDKQRIERESKYKSD